MSISTPLRRRLSVSLLLLVGLLFNGPGLHAQSNQRANHSQVSLISHSHIQDLNSPFEIGVTITPDPNWHSYWKHPGSIGLPLEAEWQLPKEHQIEQETWPIPSLSLSEIGPSFVYKAPATIVFKMRLNPTQHQDHIQLLATLNWLVCKEDLCVPESAKVSLNIPIQKNTPIQPHPDILNTLAQAPKNIQSHIAHNHSHSVLLIPNTALNSPVNKATFFPENSEQLSLSGPLRPQTLPTDTALILPNKTNTLPKGLLIINDNTAYLINAEPNPNPERLDLLQVPTPESLLWLLFAAFLGGLILNIMPCVFPVLSLKALSIMKKSTLSSQSIRAQGLAYTLGVVISFVLLGALLIGLKLSGQQLGWGFQLQSPVFVSLMMNLMLLVGLNLSGVYELPTAILSLQSWIGTQSANKTPQSGLKRSFLTGILATIMATPCTAPLMGPALGVALNQPSLNSLLIFTLIGLGLASPFLLISLVPKSAKLLPKPGPWLNIVKPALAFPMYATAAWLLWVLTQQLSASELIMPLSGLILIPLLIWSWQQIRPKHPIIKGLLLLAIIVIMTATLPFPNNTPKNNVPFSMSGLQQDGPLLVEVTAAWCLSCQYNKTRVLEHPDIQAALSETQTTHMIADWTEKDPVITQYLASFNRSGVPLYVYYRPPNAPLILPQLLNRDDLLELLNP